MAKNLGRAISNGIELWRREEEEPVFKGTFDLTVFRICPLNAISNFYLFIFFEWIHYSFYKISNIACRNVISVEIYDKYISLFLTNKT